MSKKNIHIIEDKEIVKVKKYIVKTADLVEELKNIINMLLNKRIDEHDFEKNIYEYMQRYHDFFYNEKNEVRPSVKNALGKRKVKMIESAVKEWQRKLKQ